MKKGQAFFEFVMTYGWAILIAAVLLFVIWRFGLFSIPQTFNEKKDVCDLSCGDLMIRIQNSQYLYFNLAVKDYVKQGCQNKNPDACLQWHTNRAPVINNLTVIQETVISKAKTLCGEGYVDRRVSCGCEEYGCLAYCFICDEAKQ